ncbi:MAG: (2Fe-2S)-binding protein [Helicobacteraceae bacterium]|jgi:NADH-quinone oxidoreductase subunit G|nr:(2Fe-2S)-binding protein [Helicobacteraceae bacterium]
MINFTIDGVAVTARGDETILQAARANGIYIPTLCYLAKLTPAGSCRLCVVEIDGVEGFALSCQTKVAKGINVRVQSAALNDVRRKVTQMMCVNHPLQCGVCDKSGECELQDKILEFKVTEQIFSAKEQPRKNESWQFLSYDPFLCILCERCARSCNEVVGSAALFVTRGGYNSKINYNTARCIKCGECAAVCPTGAIVTKDFKYRANAWELAKTPSVCLHCPIACNVAIETKRGAIVRIAGDVENSALCGMGRFSFHHNAFGEFSSDLLRGVKTVLINGDETNEEAFLLQKIADKLNFTIVNNRIASFAEFLRIYGEASGESLYNATLANLANADKIWVFAPSLCDEAPLIRGAISQANLKRHAEAALFSPIEDQRLTRLLTKIVRYEAGAEEGVFALLLNAVSRNCGVEPRSRKELKKWLAELDAGNISAESSAGEEEFENFRIAQGKTVIVVGSEIYSHDRAANIAVTLGVLRSLGADILMIPPTANALGIILSGVKVERGAAEVALPNAPFEAKEGTIVNMSKKLLPLNAAIDYHGESIPQAAKKLGAAEIKYAIDITPKLPFNKLKFDEIPQSGVEIAPAATQITRKAPGKIEAIGEFNGAVAHFTFARAPFAEKGRLVGSPQFAAANKLTNGDETVIETNRGKIIRKFAVSQTMKGTIAKLEAFDLTNAIKDAAGYRFEAVKIGRQNG